MSLFYEIAYHLGFTPWEDAATHPPAASQIAGLFDREECGRNRPYGKALDLGCGTGHWSIELSSRSWQVTGIDLVAKAVSIARESAHKAGIDVEFIQGDVTALRAAGVGIDFHLIWDFGTLHGLPQSKRQEVGRELDEIAAPDATLLILAWAPGRRGPLPRGASRADIEGAFPNWRVVDEQAFDSSGLPPLLRNVNPRCYRLRRN